MSAEDDEARQLAIRCGLDPDRHVCREGFWWRLYDARGIYCCRVCDECEAEKRAQFRPEVFTNPAYEHDEPIEED